MSDPSLSIGLLHLVAMAYVIATLSRQRVNTWLAIGIAELSALALVALIGVELVLRRIPELYSVWFFMRNTIGGFGLAWLIFEKIGSANRPK